MKRRYWYVIVTYIIMQFSGVVFAPLLHESFQIDLMEALIYWNIISFTIALIIILLLMRPDMAKSQDRQAMNLGGTIKWSILGIFMAWFAQIAAALIETNVLGIEPGSDNTTMIMDLVRSIPLFLIIPTIFAPVLEEIIFRKIIFGVIYKRTNFFIAATISALIFGFIHGEPIHILIYASMGYVFAFLYIKTKRIIVPILAHMGMNTIAVVGQLSIDPELLDQRLKELQMILMGG